MTVYQQLLDYRSSGEKGLFVLLDPDKVQGTEIRKRAEKAQEAGAKAVLIGGSHLIRDDFDEVVRRTKEALEIPLVIFPGGASQISPHADAILFLSLISGRNPQYLIGEHVSAAPRVKGMGLEVIPTAYMLIESGKVSAIEFISGTNPIPRDQFGIASAHALAGEMLGLKLVYLEAGSGAKLCVPPDMVTAVAESVKIPVIVGGGIRFPEDARAIAKAGADFLVVGNALEEDSGESLLSEIVRAVAEG